MKFSRIIGKIDKDLVTKAEEALTKVFLELGTRYTNDHVGSGMGGDPLIFSLMFPLKHNATLNISTAATDGKQFFWNPKFVLKHSRHGLRIICAHEAWHSLYMHPNRRGSRLPKLWNIAVDYIVNANVMDDFKARKMNATEMFNKHCGKFMTLEQYAQFIKDPKKPIKGFEDILNNAPSNSKVKLPDPTEDRELTEEELKELERREKKVTFFYADPELPDDMKSPERIYDYLYKLLPKCAKCGRIGAYPQNNSGGKQNGKGKKGNSDQSDGDGKGQDKKKGKGKKSGKDKSDQGQNDQHDHGNGDPCDCSDHQNQGQGDDGEGSSCPGQCSGCGGIDVLDIGGTIDDHIDATENEEKLAKRIAEAMEAAKKMAGSVPGALEDELGKLIAPRVTWKDDMRSFVRRCTKGNSKNDWNNFRIRPMFCGVMTPKRKGYKVRFGCCLDTSGSMSNDDMAFGISQLASLDAGAEGTIVPTDCQVYWDKATKITDASKSEELRKVKVVGRGGTMLHMFINEYKNNIGDCDFLVMITDGYLCDSEFAEMQNPGIPVYWLITSGHSTFSPPFGKVYDLRTI